MARTGHGQLSTKAHRGTAGAGRTAARVATTRSVGRIGPRHPWHPLRFTQSTRSDSMETPRVRGAHFAKRRLRPVPLLLPLLAVSLVASLASGAGASLPPQASEAGHDHAHSTHGPDGLALDRRGRTPGDAPFAVDAHAAWQSCEYDGVAPSIDSADLEELKNRPQVHAIYVHPAKTASRFPAYAAMFQADAR